MTLSTYIRDAQLARSADVQAAYKALRIYEGQADDVVGTGLRTAQILAEMAPQVTAAQLAFSMVARAPLMANFTRVSHHPLIQKHFSEEARALAEGWICFVNEEGIVYSQETMPLPLRQIMAAGLCAMLEKTFDRYLERQDEDSYLALARTWNEAQESLDFIKTCNMPDLTRRLEHGISLARVSIRLPDDPPPRRRPSPPRLIF